MAMSFRQPGKTGIGNLKAGKPAGSFNGNSCHSSSNERKIKMKVNSIIFYLCAGMCSSALIDSAFSMNNNWKQPDSNGHIEVPGEITSIDSGVFNYQEKCSRRRFNRPFGRRFNKPSGRRFSRRRASNGFSGCAGLTSITIPTSVKSIGNDAFYRCSGLTSITVPNSVISIGALAFRRCYNAKFTVPSQCMKDYLCAFHKIADNRIIVNEKLANPQNAWAWPEDGHVKIPYGVTNIDNKMFLNRNDIESITLPTSVTSIGACAFNECSGLTSITIPTSVTSIGKWAFNKCSGLTSIAILGSVTEICDWTFSGCSGLTSITIPTSVTSIGKWAFNKCSGLASITIPTSVTSIGDDAFNECAGLSSIAIPDGVTKIGDHAFRDCSGLTSITIPTSVTKIGSCAFLGCQGLTSITIPDSVTEICAGTFSGCSGLTSITIPTSVTSIGNRVRSVRIFNNIQTFGAFEGCTGLSSIRIPARVTKIGQNTFNGCTGLTSITIPYRVISIGKNAFSGCSGLTSITIPGKVVDIARNAFSNCGIQDIIVTSESVKELVQQSGFQNNIIVDANAKPVLSKDEQINDLQQKLMATEKMLALANRRLENLEVFLMSVCEFEPCYDYLAHYSHDIDKTYSGPKQWFKSYKKFTPHLNWPDEDNEPDLDSVTHVEDGTDDE